MQKSHWTQPANAKKNIGFEFGLFLFVYFDLGSHLVGNVFAGFCRFRSIAVMDTIEHEIIE